VCLCFGENIAEGIAIPQLLALQQSAAAIP
jgi:hypothetical protein